MDSISQAALGAAIGEACLGKKGKYKGAISGAIIATIPDLDIIILPFFDSMERISIHRGFSHSFVFCLLGAFLIAWLLSRMKWFSDYSYRRLFLFSFLALVTHVLLDAFTAYGTQLLLPFSDYRVSFDSINIVDPFYTLPLLIGLIGSLYDKRTGKYKPVRNQIGLFISTTYLLLTLVNKSYIHHFFQEKFAEEKIEYNLFRTIPVSIGNVNWYGVARNDSTLYMAKYSEIKRNEITIDSFPVNELLLNNIDKKLAEALKWFAQDLYVVAEKNGIIRLYNLQCDMQGVRYYGDYKAPTAFYFEVNPHAKGKDNVKTGMHPANNE